jgi:hypothetical protein
MEYINKGLGCMPTTPFVAVLKAFQKVADGTTCKATPNNGRSVGAVLYSDHSNHFA